MRKNKILLALVLTTTPLVARADFGLFNETILLGSRCGGGVCANFTVHVGNPTAQSSAIWVGYDVDLMFPVSFFTSYAYELGLIDGLGAVSSHTIACSGSNNSTCAFHYSAVEQNVPVFAYYKSRWPTDRFGPNPIAPTSPTEGEDGGSKPFKVEAISTPEPLTILLCGIGLLALGIVSRRKSKTTEK
jgi:hypothetical protein